MAVDTEAAQINALAIQMMLDLPKLYGPNGFDGKAGPPANLVAVLMQLETAAVDPTLLSGNQTIASVETQTLTDLQGIAEVTNDELRAASRPIGGAGREQLAFDRYRYPGEVADLQANAKLFTAGTKPPITIVNPPPPSASGVEQYQVTNTSTGVADWENGSAYSGPVLKIQNQFITVTTDSINVTATKLNNFIHTGSGNDAIDVSFFGETGGGTNVLDGGTGSNFLVGNFNSADSFYVDDRAAASNIWSTVVNFHAGDAATIWGITPNDFNLTWLDSQGAVGYTGLTLNAIHANRPNASLTLAGYAAADLQNGKLSVTYGNDPISGSNYMFIQGH